MRNFVRHKRELNLIFAISIVNEPKKHDILIPLQWYMLALAQALVEVGGERLERALHHVGEYGCAPQHLNRRIYEARVAQVGKTATMDDVNIF